jgi:tetratricopeptide (TPR) repeat protein
MPAPTCRVDELGFPLPGSFDELTEQPPCPKRGWGPFFYKYRWGVLLLLLPLLFGETLITAARRFVAQRLLGNAEMQFDRDQLPEALASVNRALSWEPDSFECWQAFSRRAEIYEEMPDHLQDSLDDLNEVIKRLDDPTRSKRFSESLSEAYGSRAWVFERLGRHREAIADSTTALNIATALNVTIDLNIAPDRLRAGFLNQRAYLRALGGTELDQALQDVQKSLILVPNDPNVVDTRGYIFFRLGKYDTALQDIEQAIRWETAPRVFWFQGEAGPRSLPSGIQLRKHREALAVMFHHCGEIRKKLGQDTKGDEDIRRALHMGYDPERGVY